MLQNKYYFLSYEKIIFPLYALLLVFFVSSGFVKSFFKAANFIELDVTILSMVFLMLLSFFLLIRYRIKVEQLVIIILFILFLSTYSISALYTTSESYYINKLFALTGLIFSFVFGFLSTKEVRSDFFKLYPIFSMLAVSIYFILTFSNLSAEALKDFSGNSLVTGEMLGASILMFYFSNIRYKYALILLSFSVMIALGARGPLLFSLIILFFIALNNFHKFNFKIPVSLGILVILAAFIIGSNKDNELSSSVVKTLTDGFSRFELLFSEDKGASINSRAVMITKTLEHIDKNILFGTGVGSFGVEIYGKDFRAYPHNVPLEIWFESGVLAFLFFNLFVLTVIVYLLKNGSFLLLSLLVYQYLNMNKSSSLEELRLFFLVAGFSLVLVNEKEKKCINYV